MIDEGIQRDPEWKNSDLSTAPCASRITSSLMLVFPSLRFRNILQLLQVGTATCRLLVRDQVVQRDEVNRNTEEGASNATLPRNRKLDTGDLRENVYRIGAMPI